MRLLCVLKECVVVCRLHLQLVCDQDDGFSPQLFFYALFKNVPPHVSVDGRQGVVEEEDVPVRVDGSGQADALLLPPRQVQPPLADLPGQQSKAQATLASLAAGSTGTDRKTLRHLTACWPRLLRNQPTTHTHTHKLYRP